LDLARAVRRRDLCYWRQKSARSPCPIMQTRERRVMCIPSTQSIVFSSFERERDPKWFRAMVALSLSTKRNEEEGD
jgi:hypothetical protein